MSALSSNALSDKAETIRGLMAASQAAHLDSIEKALAAGHELVAAKVECRHGEWLPFLERAGVHERKAQRLMTLARSGLKADTVSDLGGIKATLDFLAQLDEDDCPFLSDIVTPTCFDDVNVAEAHLPLSYVRARAALQICVTQFSTRTYSEACRALRWCNIKSSTWPGGPKMVATWARIAGDDTLEKLSKRVDELFDAALSAHTH